MRRRGAPQKFRFSFGHSSQPVARVCGMHLARGLILAHLHTNATFRPNHLERTITSLDVNASALAVTSAVDSFDQVTQMNYGPFRYPKRVVSGIRDVASVQDRLHVAPIIDISCVAHRREILDTIGTLRIDQPIIGEWDFLLNAVLHYGFTLINAETVELHYDTNTTLVERPLSFIQGVDEVYKRFPSIDGDVTQKRIAFRQALEVCLQQQAEKVQSIDGLFELVTTITGLPGLSGTVAANTQRRG